MYKYCEAVSNFPIIVKKSYIPKLRKGRTVSLDHNYILPQRLKSFEGFLMSFDQNLKRTFVYANRLKYSCM